MRAEVQGFILPKLPEQGKALVYVVRPAVTGTLIRFNVFLDDKEANSEMGYTRGKQYIYFNVEPGKHNILSKAENWASVEVDAKAGDVFFIQQEVNMGIVMARNNLFRLEDYQGKYHVKRLQLGTILKSDR
ncbi:MAG: DUF2846 domain-containing protein [Pseudomonadota bacterium]|nr:DUF2846 domain-containing protein [Pseudomonadota bacterium]